MSLLMEHQFRQLPADRQVETRPFLEAVSYLPPFFGKWTFHSVTLCVGTSYIPRDEVMWKYMWKSYSQVSWLQINWTHFQLRCQGCTEQQWPDWRHWLYYFNFEQICPTCHTKMAKPAQKCMITSTKCPLSWTLLPLYHLSYMGFVHLWLKNTEHAVTEICHNTWIKPKDIILHFPNDNLFGDHVSPHQVYHNPVSCII